MKRKVFVLASITLTFLTVCYGGRSAGVLRDGIMVSGIDGKLVEDDSNDVYYLKIDSDIKDDKSVIRSGAEIELLPSVSLEKMVARWQKEDPNSGFRIWGRVTSYGNKNYIYPFYSQQTSVTAIDSNSQETSLPLEDPNDPLQLPPDILEKLRSRKIIRSVEQIANIDIEQDQILTDRTGFIRQNAEGDFIFEFDSIGRNIERFSIELLPCQALQRAVSQQADEIDPARFKVSGTITKFRNKYYLLLQRAVQTYSHGNFTR